MPEIQVVGRRDEQQPMLRETYDIRALQLACKVGELILKENFMKKKPGENQAINQVCPGEGLPGCR